MDEQQRNGKLIEAVLRNEHYNVFTAENGEEALELTDREHIDLVVLDIMMPKMDGYEFTKLLRESNNQLPILMASAKQLPADKHMAFMVGTDDYITKPIDQTEMLLRIKALLRRAKIVSEHKITIGEVVIDYDSMTVSKGDSVQELPQKEFQLLYKLQLFYEINPPYSQRIWWVYFFLINYLYLIYGKKYGNVYDIYCIIIACEKYVCCTQVRI